MAAICSCGVKNTIPSPGRRFKQSGESVRALPIRVLTIGKKRSKGIRLIVEEYREKLKHYCSIDDVQIKSNPKNTSDVKAQIEGEDNIIIQHIRSEDWVVVLDERGLDIGSEQMAELVGDAGKTGSSAIAFCIGGPYGHGRQLRERADVTIRLSSMVLNHQIALIVLLEQLYSQEPEMALAFIYRTLFHQTFSSFRKFFVMHCSLDVTFRPWCFVYNSNPTKPNLLKPLHKNKKASN